MSAEEVKARARRAKVELTETDAAFDALRAVMVERLVGATPSDIAKMQALVCGIQALDAVRGSLRRVVEAGTIEEAAEAIREHFSPS